MSDNHKELLTLSFEVTEFLVTGGHICQMKTPMAASAGLNNTVGIHPLADWQLVPFSPSMVSVKLDWVERVWKWDAYQASHWLQASVRVHFDRFCCLPLPVSAKAAAVSREASWSFIKGAAEKEI